MDIFIFELKLYEGARKTLEQIKTLEYVKKYRRQGESLVLIGAAFDARTRNIETWEVEYVT